MATVVETVRLFTGLTDDELTDDDIASLLELNADDARLAAADALETYAGLLEAVQADDISMDGSKRAAVLMARAARLREQADEAGFSFDVVFPRSHRPELTERPLR